MEVAVLLSLMIASSAEDVRLFRSLYCGFIELKLESDVLLENVRGVIKQMKVSTSALSCKFYFWKVFVLCIF